MKYGVMVNYDYTNHEAGDILSVHSTLELAYRAGKRTGRESYMVYPELPDDAKAGETISDVNRRHNI